MSIPLAIVFLACTVALIANIRIGIELRRIGGLLEKQREILDELCK